MRRKLTETTVIIISTLKWSALATIVGTAVGISTTIFIKALNWGITLTSNYNYYFILMPIAFFFSSVMIHFLAPDAEGHGTEKVIEAIHKHSSKIKVIVIPIKLIASVITIACGGSAGKEGPSAQIGGGVASAFSDLFKFDDVDRKKLVICGISAGFASVFGTPIAGAIFGIEVLFIGSILYDALLPTFIAGLVSYHVSAHLGITYFYHPLNFVPIFSEFLLIKVIAAGILFGIVSFFFIEIMELFKKISSKINLFPPMKGFIGGLVLIILTLILSDQYLGLGLNTIQKSLEGEDILWYAFFLKIIFTAITLNLGGSGGVLTPIFFIGSTAGIAFAGLLGIDKGTLSAIGLVSVLAGSTNTPIASSIMAIELFGAGIAPYAALSCIVSFLITGHRSIYPSQIIGIRKSTSIQVEIGKEAGKIRPKYEKRKKSLIGTISKLFGLVKKKNAKGVS